MIFGLTGGIASGKSTVAKILATEGVTIVDADLVSREVVRPGTEGLAQVLKAFGPEFLKPDGHLDRPKLGTVIFSSKERRVELEGIVLPLIMARVEELVRGASGLVCLDGPTLIETGMYQKYRPLVVVMATPEIQTDRLMKRNALTREEAQARLASQVTNEVRRELADHIIDSSGTLVELRAQTLKVLSDLRCGVKSTRV
jgi:dephospho-CoA kinase